MMNSMRILNANEKDELSRLLDGWIMGVDTCGLIHNRYSSKCSSPSPSQCGAKIENWRNGLAKSPDRFRGQIT